VVVILMPMLKRRFVALVFPEGLLLLSLVAMSGGHLVPAEAAPLLRGFPVVVLAAGALLCLRFQRGRLLLALAGLALADGAMRWLAPFDSGAEHAGPVIVRTVVLVLTVSFATLAFVPERSVASPAGLRRVAVLIAELAAVFVVWTIAAILPDDTARAFDAALFSSAAFIDLSLPLGQLTTLVATLSIGVLAVRAFVRTDAESRGLLWAAIGVVIAASAGPAEGRATSYLAAAGVVLVVAAVESAYAMAYRDELTGLPTRRALDEALLRVGGRYAIAMIDIDHFMKFNDAYGHDVGDQVLRMVAGRLARVAGGGRPFRYGGEEFTVVFPGATVDDAVPHLEALRGSVAKAKFTVRGKDRPKRKPKSPRPRRVGAERLSVTVTIGVAEGGASSAAGDVVKAADEALYRGKDAGRDRVEAAYERRVALPRKRRAAASGPRMA
jgi:diguanylate cyclase (GGDEF)-like protein